MARNAIKSDFWTPKMSAGGHFVKNISYWSKMARNSIESEFRTSKMADGSHYVQNFKIKSCISILNGQKCDRNWISDIQDGRWRPFCKKKIKNDQKCGRNWILDIQNGHLVKKIIKKKFRIDLKWPEMPSKDIQNGRRQPFKKKLRIDKVSYWSEMARNAIESEFRTSKMADGSHLKKIY